MLQIAEVKKALTPFRVALAASLAFLLPLPLEAAPVNHTHQQSLLMNSQ
jgi:hypothetical protein